MADTEKRVRIHVNVEISADTLKTIVANAKAAAGRDERGIYRVDTADAVCDLISKFLDEMDFKTYVKNPAKYAQP